ncbi:MAG: Mrp/NBP35 family ATP-binding protein [Actinomycetota bacterium]|nr:Mrp/NBP35 family ATP-binding protein [Actinomycetota bacterium]
MALNEQQVSEALRPVTDPELQASIVDLGMVRGIGIRRGRVRVVVAVAEATGWRADEVVRRVTAAVGSVAGVKDVSVELTVMSPEALAEIRSRLGARPGGEQAAAPDSHAGHDHATSSRSPSSPGAQQPLGHESGRSNAFMNPDSATRVIGITSGKGGVGKSSVTVNLAISLVNAGYDVGILDADVYGFSVPAMLGIDADPTVRNEKMIPPVAFGVRCMSIGFFVDEDQPVMWRGPMLHKALEQFLVDVDWGDPDFLLVDMPPGTGDVALSMSQYLPASEVYVVTTPQAAAKRVAQRTAYMARKVNLPLRGVIENMSWFTGDDGRRYELFGSGAGEQLADELGVPLLGKVPLENRLREGGDTGRPVTVADPGGEASRAFASIAGEIIARGRARIFRSELTIR